MFIRALKISASVLAACFLQISFVPNLPFGLESLNLILAVSIFSLFLYGFETTLFFLASSGILIDLYSFSFVGVSVIGFITCLYVTDYLFRNLLTNRSQYSFLLLFAISLLYIEFFEYFAMDIVSLGVTKSSAVVLDSEFMLRETILIATNLAFVALAYFSFNAVSHRLKPTFIEK